MELARDYVAMQLKPGSEFTNAITDESQVTTEALIVTVARGIFETIQDGNTQSLGKGSLVRVINKTTGADWNVNPFNLTFLDKDNG